MDQQIQQVILLTDDRADYIQLNNQTHVIIDYIFVEYKKKYITANIQLITPDGLAYNHKQLNQSQTYFVLIPQVTNSKDPLPQRINRVYYQINDQDNVSIEKFRNTRKTEQVQITLSAILKTIQSYSPTPQQFDFIAPKLSHDELNKRTKVPVKGGQMAFINLPRTNPPKLQPYTAQDVSQHNSEDDAWTVFNGKVYDITIYLDYHPGGKEKLMLGAGRDCTALFNQFHPWVNGHAFLEKDQVGYLVKNK